jgi:hypothetical protein
LQGTQFTFWPDKDILVVSLCVQESPTAAALKAMMLTLGFPKPPDNITALQLFDKVIYVVCAVCSFPNHR